MAHGPTSCDQFASLQRAEQLVAAWVREGGLTYRELVIELWLLGGVEFAPEIAEQRLQDPNRPRIPSRPARCNLPTDAH